MRLPIRRSRAINIPGLLIASALGMASGMYILYPKLSPKSKEKTESATDNIKQGNVC